MLCMKQFIGKCIGHLGAFLWEKGGWTGDEQYSDLTIIGKIGWHLFYKGFRMMDKPLCADKFVTKHFTDGFWD